MMHTPTGPEGVLLLLHAGLGTSKDSEIGLANAYAAGRTDILVTTLMISLDTVAIPCRAVVIVLTHQKDLSRS